MLRNRTLPIVALLAGAMMFGACAEDVAGPVDPCANPGVDCQKQAPPDLPKYGDEVLINDPDGNWHGERDRTGDYWDHDDGLK